MTGVKEETGAHEEEAVNCDALKGRLETEEDVVTEQLNKKEEPNIVSKRAQKKLLKRQQWLDTKQERRKKEKEKRKRKLEERKKENNFSSETRTKSRKRLKDCTMADSDCKVKIVFDLQFEHLMNQRDLGKTLKQIMKCYSFNRRLSNPLQLYMTSFEGRVKSEMSKNQGFENWDFNFESQKFDSAFDREKIVYLSSESENVLTELEDDKFYIIGGLVDHNSHKGLCHTTASDLGVHHARLPIDEFIKLKTRKVLAVNHVYEILAAVSEGKGWQEAFLSIIPERKGVIIKEGDGQAGQQGGEEGGEAGDNGEEGGEGGDQGDEGETEGKAG